MMGGCLRVLALAVHSIQKLPDPVSLFLLKLPAFHAEFHALGPTVLHQLENST